MKKNSTIAIIDLFGSPELSELEKTLRRRGHEVIRFKGTEGSLQALSVLGLAQARALDAIISELPTAAPMALEFARRVMAIHPGTPLVLFSEAERAEVALQAMRRGAFHWLVRPLSTESAVAHIEQALAGAASESLDQGDGAADEEWESAFDRYLVAPPESDSDDDTESEYFKD